MHMCEIKLKVKFPLPLERWRETESQRERESHRERVSGTHSHILKMKGRAEGGSRALHRVKRSRQNTRHKGINKGWGGEGVKIPDSAVYVCLFVHVSK